MISNCFKVGLLGGSCWLFKDQITPFFSNIVRAEKDPRTIQQKNLDKARELSKDPKQYALQEAVMRQIMQKQAEEEAKRLESEQNKGEIKNRNQFFLSPLLASLQKVALFHMFGFIGYQPAINNIMSFLMAPLLPFNIVSDGYLGNLFFSSQTETMEIQGKKYSMKDYCAITEKLSYAFSFVFAGGQCFCLPFHLFQVIGMSAYMKLNEGEYCKYKLALSGAVGATGIGALLVNVFPNFLSVTRQAPFLLGIFASYYAYGLGYDEIINLYLNDSKNDEYIPSLMLGYYKWTYLSMYILIFLCRRRV